jgi:hypothetical protein
MLLADLSFLSRFSDVNVNSRRSHRVKNQILRSHNLHRAYLNSSFSGMMHNGM